MDQPSRSSQNQSILRQPNRCPKVDDEKSKKNALLVLEDLDRRLRLIESIWMKVAQRGNRMPFDELLENIGLRVQTIEQTSGTHSLIPRESKVVSKRNQRSGGRFTCPADSCGRTFSRVDKFNEHLK